MYSNLVPWVRKPFTILSNPDGYVGDRMYTASYLGLANSASFTIDRVLGVEHTMVLVQSDYWVEDATDTLSFIQTLAHNKLRPLSASSAMALTDDPMVSGGHTGLVTIHNATGDGLLYAGQPIYVKPDGHLGLSASDLTATEAGVAGIMYTDGGGIVNGEALFISDGELELDDWTTASGNSTLTPGAPYYLSTTEGVMSISPPIGDLNYIVKVGRAISKRVFAIDLGEGVRL